MDSKPYNYIRRNIDGGKASMTFLNVLIAAGADVNAYVMGETVLHVTTEWSHIEIARLFIDRGADINAMDDEQSRTPLHYAVLNSQYGIAKLLLESGADVNAKDDYENTAVHYAVWIEHLDMVALLIKHNADVSIMNNEGPISIRTTKNEKIIKLLEAAVLQCKNGCNTG